MSWKLSDQNFLIKFVFWLDSKTILLKKLERERAEWLLTTINIYNIIHNSDKLLDVGSGIGDISTLIKDKTECKVFGIDIVDYRRKEIRGRNRYDFTISDANELPFKDETFDKVLILFVLHHIFTPVDVIKEAIRVAKVGGKIIIFEDLINYNRPWKIKLYYLIDNILNLSLRGNPNTNKSSDEWTQLLEKELKLKKVDEQILKWGPVNYFSLGYFLYEK